MQLKTYQTRAKKLPGTNDSEVYRNAFYIFSQICKKSKRRAYVRSAYFNKEKIFLSIFWSHLKDKLSFKDKTRRLKYFPCAIDLIQNSKFAPKSKINPNRNSEILHRFAGVTPQQEIFFVQIKQRQSNNQKYLISIFPLK